MIEYGLLKFIHIGALIFWLGPPLGAWLVFKAVEDGRYLPNSVAAKVSRVFFITLIIEHVAFLLLLISGFAIATQYQLFGNEWLTTKLYIVLLVIVPLEIIDVLLGNWLASRASKRLYQGAHVPLWQRKALALYHGVFTKLALLIIPLSVSLIMLLATSKTNILN